MVLIDLLNFGIGRKPVSLPLEIASRSDIRTLQAFQEHYQRTILSHESPSTMCALTHPSQLKYKLFRLPLVQYSAWIGSIEVSVLRVW